MPYIRQIDRAIRWSKILPLLLALVGVLVFSNSLESPFIFDDERHIIDNPNIANPWPLLPILKESRPVVSLTLAFNYKFGTDIDVRGYHLVNLTIHILAALALYGLVRSTLLLPKWSRCFGDIAPWIAFAAAVLWMVHPLVTQAVNYIVQRAESMMAMFYLMTLYCAVRSFTSAGSKTFWYAAAIATCALGMGCKPVMVSAPLIVLIYDRTFVTNSFRAALRQRTVLYIGLVAGWVLLILIRGPSQLLTSDAAAGFNLEIINPWVYLYSQSHVICHYLRLAIWPNPLVFDYWWLPARSMIEIWPYLVIIVFLLIASGVALWRKNWLGVIGAMFFCVLSPTSSFVPIADLAVEHRMYLPLAAIIVAGVIGGYVLLCRLKGPRQAHVLGGILVLVLAILLAAGTVRRNRDYKSARQLWQTVVDHRPLNIRARNSLGIYMARDGDDRLALDQYNTVLADKPDFVDSLLARAEVYLKLNEFDDALVDLTRVMALPTGDLQQRQANFNAGVATLRLEQFEQSESYLRKAIKIDPNFTKAYNNLGYVLRQQEKFEEAEQAVRKLIELNPLKPDAYLNLAMILSDMGRVDEAIVQLSLVTAMVPHDRGFAVHLARKMEAMGQTAQAISEYQRAINLQPPAPDVMIHLAGLLATHPDAGYRDGKRALDLVRHAHEEIKVRGAHWTTHVSMYDTLGAVQAERGIFNKAVKSIDEAIRIAKISGAEADVMQPLKEHRQLYESKKPLRREPGGD